MPCHWSHSLPQVNINKRSSDIFMGYRKGSVERNGLIHSLLTKLKTAERRHKRPEEHFGSCQKSMMEYFAKIAIKSSELFPHKTSPQTFGRVLNTSLTPAWCSKIIHIRNINRVLHIFFCFIPTGIHLLKVKGLNLDSYCVRYPYAMPFLILFYYSHVRA